MPSPTATATAVAVARVIVPASVAVTVIRVASAPSATLDGFTSSAITVAASSSSSTVSIVGAGAATAAASLTVATICTSTASGSSTSLFTAPTVSVADADAASAAKWNVAPAGNSIRSETAVSVAVNALSCTGSTVAVSVAVSPSVRMRSDGVSVTDGPSTMVATELAAPSAIRPSTVPENRIPTLKVSPASSTLSSYASNVAVAKRPRRPRALPVPEGEKSANTTVVVVSFFS